MSTATLIIGSVLVAFSGFLTHQILETLLNTALSVSKSKIKSAKKVTNAPGYYLCMGDNCHDQNITQVAKNCKANAPSLTAKRVKKIKELTKAAKVIGKFAQDLEKVLPH
ncbi:13857_t:CDS:2 [Funneliformis geosporum]|uniref:6887_t:CDS:1 n=1 Tax=Funneliformis geosporum TaxID=1117311 RepID=A0A9W4T7L3_9GLOM|nr:13857_t:CDS:2 [Funneliformis geosporum]CAI2195214.1 6887_t:CDS:2 [Funneliformis geosporum]